MSSRAATLDALRDRIARLERPVRHGVLPFGVAAIDAALPGRGLALGALHEFLGVGGDEEDGAVACGFIAGILARLGGGPVLWCQKRPDLYGPGLAAHGLDPARLVLVAASRDEEVLWALEEGLRMPGLAAAVGEIGRLSMVAGRRLQLAAEHSGITLLLLRRWHSAAAASAGRAQPSAADTRWRIGALPSAPLRLGWGVGLGPPRWRVELLRVRGGRPGVWEIEVADATGHVSVSAGLADRPAAPGGGGSAPLRRAG